MGSSGGAGGCAGRQGLSSAPQVTIPLPQQVELKGFTPPSNLIPDELLGKQGKGKAGVKPRSSGGFLELIFTTLFV